MGDSGGAVREFLAKVDDYASRPLALSTGVLDMLQALEAHLRGLGQVSWEHFGSSACGTSVAGHSDVDVLMVFGDPIRHGLSHSRLPYSVDDLRRTLETGVAIPRVVDPATAFDVVAAAIGGARVPGMSFGAPRRDFPAVTFPATSGGPSLDVVPSIEADALWDETTKAPSSGLVRVAYPARRDRWLGTEPKLRPAVLDFSPTGRDYDARTIIRLLKVIVRRRRIPVRAYFLEVFALRWLEGSEAFPADSTDEIVSAMGSGWQPRRLGLLADDLADLLTALARHLSLAASRSEIPTMVDLTSPETKGTVEACGKDALADAANSASEARLAGLPSHSGSSQRSLAGWQLTFLEFP